MALGLTPTQPGLMSSTAGQERPAVYGDAAYGAGEFLEKLDDAGVEAKVKTQPPTNTGGRFTKDAFDIDLDNDTVTLPEPGDCPDPPELRR